MLHGNLLSFGLMQASWVCFPLQTKLKGCADSAVLLCEMPSRYAVRSGANPQATDEAERLH